MLISNPLKKFEKNAPKKVIGKTDLISMSKNEKVHISITFLLIILFFVHFFNCFNGFVISMKFCIF
jgi:hypothetical protein